MKSRHVFLIALAITLAGVGAVISIYLNINRAAIDVVDVQAPTTTAPSTTSSAIELEDAVDLADLDQLADLVSVSKRLNIILLGIEGARADTIIVASYDPARKLLDFVTVPRDTYNKVPGHNGLGQKKINAVYGFGERDGGSKGMKSQVSALLGIPIRYYITVDYAALAAIVDTIGGVEIDVSRAMNYQDPTATPPLNIDIAAGRQLLNGKRSVDYLRWRKNNGQDGSDLDRTARQIDFVKIAIVKTLREFKLVDVMGKVFQELDTNMPLSEMMYYASTLVGFDPGADIATYRLPGQAVTTDLSYYMYDEVATEALMIDMYRRGYQSPELTSQPEGKSDDDEN